MSVPRRRIDALGPTITSVADHQQEKLRTTLYAVDTHAQQCEEVGPPLHSIDDDQTVEGALTRRD